MSFESTQNINSDFFAGMYKEVWRHEVPQGLTEAETDFIEEIAGLQKLDNVLDIMCGFGRHAIELARRGYNVTAIDNSKEYIDEIKTITENESLAIEAKHADVSRISFSGNFDAAICMGNSIAFFNADTVLDILKKIAGSLKSGGVFIINTWTIAEIAIKNFQERTWHYIHDYKFLTENKFLFQPTRIESSYTILASSGETETLTGIDYIFSLSELEKMFNNAGLTMGEIYSTPRKRKYNFGDRRAYIIASKP
jgi:2-polyprenyl-3-methyl-5-hydroxy-6-metoxy-1,4-benzoquinol methylase